MKMLVTLFAMAGLLNGIMFSQTLMLSVENYELRQEIATLHRLNAMSLKELGEERVS